MENFHFIANRMPRDVGKDRRICDADDSTKVSLRIDYRGKLILDWKFPQLIIRTNHMCDQQVLRP